MMNRAKLVGYLILGAWLATLNFMALFVIYSDAGGAVRRLATVQCLPRYHGFFYGRCIKHAGDTCCPIDNDQVLDEVKP